ncbi:MAG TPA: aldose epimerase family protein [Streptosporangiaceae bacterium]|nr:aldose epimerase family protein [Streptosporangiaceae bacterium]
MRIGAVGVLALAAVGSLAAMRAAPVASSHACSGPTVSKQFFGRTIEPYTGKNTSVFRYTLTNCRGVQAKILTFGGIVQSIQVPARHGAEADVVLGFKTLRDYVKFDSPPVTAGGGPYFGETIGRYGNRIAKGTFKLNGQTYTLPINNGVNSLHGGLVGFGNHIWASKAVTGPGTAGVQLTLVSPNRDASGAPGSPGCPTGCTGYPAQLTVVVTYTLNNAGQLGIHYKATNNDPKLSTVLNLTNHSYFNLAGEASPAGSAYKQFVQMNANNYSPTDATQIPLPLTHGVPVAGTPFDFRAPHTIGSRIDDVSAPQNLPAQFRQFNQLLIAQGYDHNWILNKQTAATTGPDGLNLAARAFDPESGRALTVWTDQPGVQFYSGNFLNGTLVGISGHTYRQAAGYTFETQHFPDSPNEPTFPPTVLGPGKTIVSTTIFAFHS